MVPGRRKSPRWRADAAARRARPARPERPDLRDLQSRAARCQPGAPPPGQHAGRLRRRHARRRPGRCAWRAVARGRCRHGGFGSGAVRLRGGGSPGRLGDRDRRRGASAQGDARRRCFSADGRAGIQRLRPPRRCRRDDLRRHLALRQGLPHPRWRSRRGLDLLRSAGDLHLVSGARRRRRALGRDRRRRAPLSRRRCRQGHAGLRRRGSPSSQPLGGARRQPSDRHGRPGPAPAVVGRRQCAHPLRLDAGRGRGHRGSAGRHALRRRAGVGGEPGRPGDATAGGGGDQVGRRRRRPAGDGDRGWGKRGGDAACGLASRRRTRAAERARRDLGGRVGRAGLVVAGGDRFRPGLDEPAPLHRNWSRRASLQRPGGRGGDGRSGNRADPAAHGNPRSRLRTASGRRSEPWGVRWRRSAPADCPSS